MEWYSSHMASSKKRTSKRRQTRAKAKAAGFRSGFEVVTAMHLDKADVYWEYESEKIPFTVPETPRNYTVDFVIPTNTGKVVIETKGRLKLEDRKKLVWVRDQHNLDLRLVFQNANVRLSKNSPTTYGEWATKNGFKWAHRTIPPEWLKEFNDKQK
jgi:hypothetical protein